MLCGRVANAYIMDGLKPIAQVRFLPSANHVQVKP